MKTDLINSFSKKALFFGISGILISHSSFADIYFSAKVAGPVTNIFSSDTEGKITKITENVRWRDLKPNIAPNGDIVFMSNKEESEKINMQRKFENYNLFLADKKSGAIKKITDAKGQDILPKFGPNGIWIAYLLEQDSKRFLHVINRKTNEKKDLVNAEQIYDFSWSPSGDKIALSTVNADNSSLKSVDINSQKITTLYEYPAINLKKLPAAYNTQITSVTWSPDGKKIAFVSHPLKRGISRDLLVYELQDKTITTISDKKNHVQDNLDWSSDSQSLLYSSLVDYKFYYNQSTKKKVYEGGMHIFISTLDGKTTQLTQGDHLNKNPVFSPNGQQIAFIYGEQLRDRTLQLKKMDTTGKNIKTLYNKVAQTSILEWK